MNLKNEVSIREVGAPVAAAANTDQNSDRIDMANWDGVVFVVPVTDSVSTGVATLKVEQNTADSDTGMAALSGAEATATCTINDDLNNKLLVVDVYRPRERYVQGVITSATANIAFGNTLAILYRGRKSPVSDHSTVLDSALVASPAEA
ncbi:MAG: hypothetical protein BPHS0_08 [Phage 5P_3]|nr:MAG: hypothetical protein BPHS0_08 [Phage 5P_3]